MSPFRHVATALALAAAAPAAAGNTLVPAGVPVAVAKSALTVTPAGEWNRLGARRGRFAETWTLDGDTLNDLTFYGGVGGGQPIFREQSKKLKPLPHFSTTMLLSDVPTLFEQSYRIRYDTPLIAIVRVEPATFAGAKGVRFTYSFTRGEVERRGEAQGAIIGGKLYLASFEAPVLHFFDAGIAPARAVIESARLVAVTAAR